MTMTETVGTFRYPMEIAASEAGPFVHVEALVNTGALYSLVPREILERLGVQARARRQFVVADGRVIERDITEIVVRLEGATRHTVCIMGDEGVQALLGAVTLEAFGLTPDPLTQRLVPIQVLPLLRV